MKSFPRIFMILCALMGIIIFLLMILDLGEAEVPGWGFNISRSLNHYIHRNKLTSAILPKNFCDKTSLLVIMVISSPPGFEARKVIRRTWGKERSVMGYKTSLYFLLGETIDLDVQNKINNESILFDDIIQERFIDSYNNLTLKSAMMLKLYTLKCAEKTQFLLKIDDDIYLNLPKLVSDLINRNVSENLLMGSVICGARPIKNYKDKWYAGPNYLFPFNVYPNYISGTSYLMSSDVAEKLLETALTTPIFHLEDVYLTGICARKLSLNLTHNPFFTYRYYEDNYCLFKPLITIHYQGPDSIQRIHSAVRDPVVEKHCQEEREVFLVHRWFVDNVLMVNKTKRRRKCS